MDENGVETNFHVAGRRTIADVLIGMAASSLKLSIYMVSDPNGTYLSALPL